jgi:hypothetical protein
VGNRKAGLSGRIDHDRPFRRMSRRPTISIDWQHVTRPRALDRRAGAIASRDPAANRTEDGFAALRFMPFNLNDHE